MLEKRGTWFKEFVRCESYKKNIIVTPTFNQTMDIFKEIRSMFEDYEIEHTFASKNRVQLLLHNGMEFRAVNPNDTARGCKANRVFTVYNLDDKLRDCVIRPLMITTKDGLMPEYCVVR